uniref:UTP23 sensor motif region domain-containing protein n=1 Tax=Oncorhynchus mykiss TaxID=8022 RepID=A0A8K9XTQ1_ONCMY
RDGIRLGTASISRTPCLLSMLEGTNPHHYFVVTQICDQEVTSGLKKIPGVPLLYIILNIIVLDKPSLCSVNHVQAVAQRDCHPSPKRKRKISNPNPLSCLKKKKQPQTQLLKTEGKRKKSRQRKVANQREGPSLKPTTNPLVVGRYICFEGKI